ncbi:hypothetical protein [Candidatus Regiella endosymbiont of Tuberolachnus salignus]|uniref:hypothetical protein n=1 Tax=Candidatus Regiella endosymbiont of Tuberolachnus salignus TaxID=3077956 RepID=UPI0030CAE293
MSINGVIGLLFWENSAELKNGSDLNHSSAVLSPDGSQIEVIHHQKTTSAGGERLTEVGRRVHEGSLSVFDPTSGNVNPSAEGRRMGDVFPITYLEKRQYDKLATKSSKPIQASEFNEKKFLSRQEIMCLARIPSGKEGYDSHNWQN